MCVRLVCVVQLTVLYVPSGRDISRVYKAFCNEAADKPLVACAGCGILGDLSFTERVVNEMPHLAMENPDKYRQSSELLKSMMNAYEIGETVYCVSPDLVSVSGGVVTGHFCAECMKPRYAKSRHPSYRDYDPLRIPTEIREVIATLTAAERLALSRSAVGIFLRTVCKQPCMKFIPRRSKCTGFSRPSPSW